jgi:hypothetical protein
VWVLDGILHPRSTRLPYGVDMGLKIFHQNLVYNIGDSFTASKEAASMPGANLAGLHPSEPWNCPSYTNAEYVCSS